MPTPNTNPQAAAFVDQQIRPIADALAQLYYDAKRVTSLYQLAAPGGLGNAVLPATDDPVISPSAPANDGRPIVTGNLALGIIFRLNDFITYYETNGSANLASVLAVAPQP